MNKAKQGLFLPLAAVMTSVLLQMASPQALPRPAEAVSSTDEYQALLKKYNVSTRDAIRNPVMSEAAGKAFLKFSREHSSDPKSLNALTWVATHCLYRPEAEEAMGLIAQVHARRRDLSAVLQDIDRLYGDSFLPQEGMLRAILRDNPYRAVRAEAALALAHEIRARLERYERDQAEFIVYAQGRAGDMFEKPDNTYAIRPSGDPRKLLTETEAAYERIAREFADVKRGERTFGEIAQGERRILLGKSAPDIVGEDADGKRLRLTDYRGKVVVLTFTMTGCVPCHKSYPALRDLEQRLHNRPFALLSVYSTQDRQEIRHALEAKEITWPCWWDKGNYGRICSDWGVDGFPTAYVLDTEGVVRFKGESPDVLGQIAEALLQEPKVKK